MEKLTSVDFTEEWNDKWAWLAIESYFNECGMVKTQIDSFNKFIDSNIQSIVDETQDMEFQMESKDPSDMRPYGVTIHFGQVTITDPFIQESDGTRQFVTPNMARIRSLTYASASYIAIHRTTYRLQGTIREDETTEIVHCGMGDLPIMLQSKLCVLSKVNPVAMGECEHDEGGYFIVNGNEKVLVAQERINMNQIYIFKKPLKNCFEAQIRSVAEKSSKPGLAFFIRCYSIPPRDSLAKVGPVIRVIVPYCKYEIPIFVFFRALGVLSDKEIIERICYGLTDVEMIELLRPSIEDGSIISTQEEALDLIGSSGIAPGMPLQAKITYAQKILREECFPHMGISLEHFEKKSFFTGYMTNKLLLTHMGRRQIDDRDHFANKRMDTAGSLLGQLFRSLFYQMVKSMKKMILAEIHKSNISFKITSVMDDKIIGRGLKYSLATGNWGTSRIANSSKVGVAQVLNRLSFSSTLSHLRRLNTPLGRDGKLARPRQLHNTHWGMVCPAETPEGHACGLVKNLSLMSYITTGSDSVLILHLLEKENMILLDTITPEKLTTSTKVLVNGIWVGNHEIPSQIVSTFRKLRRNGTIQFDTSVVWDIPEKELRIFTDAGRICRPLFTVDDMKLNFNATHAKHLFDKDWGWSKITSEGIVEYIDTEEEESTMIAMTPWEIQKSRSYKEQNIDMGITTYTHCEMHPSMILGVCASIIPFPDHNQSPRNVYQSAMGKQAIGCHASNFQERYDTLSHVVHYPQKPLCGTKSMDFIKFKELPAGQNTIVAIACYSGYNQEDSLILNQSSIDRGWQRSTYYRTLRDEEKPNEKIMLPCKETTSGMKRGTYHKLDEDGIILPGEKLNCDDIMIGKVTAVNVNNASSTSKVQLPFKDISTTVKSGETGTVDSVMVTTNERGSKMVKVRIRNLRVPQIGDKFASRHGQKGTCGMLYRQEDMPFTQIGMCPDLVMNPHAIPSRMTIGHLFETLLGKVACIMGIEGDATPFMATNTVKSISDMLHGTGHQRYGNERLYHGHTGKPLESLVYFGPTYYQRLKHMVDDKVHSRARGPVTSLVRQPTEGRSRSGGLRFGEMERDCMISHGAASFLRERLFTVSDHYKVHVCNECGLFAIANYEKNQFICKGCKQAGISNIALPYSCKLLFQELMSMAIAPRMMIES
jgi:DNA-directed RNA polymerase II subunit RPB2